MKTNNRIFGKILSAFLLCVSTSALAGPIIIAGTDADDHGFVSGGVNQTGWAFMQKAFENIGGAVTNGSTSIVCLGCNGSSASQAFQSATMLSSLGGAWTVAQLSNAVDIVNFFNGSGTQNVNNTAIIYMPTVSSNVGGGIDDTQLAIVNANGTALNNFVAAGGGLFTQEQANSNIGYGWLMSLIPGFTVLGDNIGGINDSTSLALTADGAAAFPGLTNGDLTNATPWHAYFENYGTSLKALAVGNGDGVGGLNDAVVLGGGVGAVIVCGAPGQPDCPTEVPEPATLPLLVAGALGLLAWRRKRVS